MSHELRTPLNSLLILAELLGENTEKNLTPTQVEYARTIQGAGKDLLGLINEILDLSKIESGTVTLDYTEVAFASLQKQIARIFQPVADSRGLSFTIELAPTLPETTWTDEKRLLQVLKNLLSNAFKFTERGGVNISIQPTVSGWSVDHTGLNSADTVISFIVTDTGIGVPTNKHNLIFEAFQQADTGTSRKYGGTGLGLSISRELARLLGGELRLLWSEPNRGSTFALFVPLRSMAIERAAEEGMVDEPERWREPVVSQAPQMQDDREAIRPHEQVLLTVENDPRFASVLLAAARELGIKGIVTARGADTLELTQRFKPSLITLDLHLPDIDGWSVMERLKRNPAMRHIPVLILSAEDDRARGLRSGAIQYLTKPVTPADIRHALMDGIRFARRQVRHLLLVEADSRRRNDMLALIGGDDLQIQIAANGMQALTALKKTRYDCIVLDPALPDIAPDALVESAHRNALNGGVPLILFGLHELPKPDQDRLAMRLNDSAVKEVRSLERLLDETSLFLHRDIARLPARQRQLLEKLHGGAASLQGRKVMVVDDDVRNIFALASVLERNRMEVISAENGRSAIELLQQQPDTDIVLMDIMMPEMDGYETMRKIRRLRQFESLPMIALTAKAMHGDREKCIEAGASDYVSKPVDTDCLLSLMRTWIYR
jgi:CheY-like chemotaxis protein